MPGRRRNLIRRRDAVVVHVVAVAAAVVAALVGVSPTGAPVVDALLTGGAVWFVVWAGASAPWWALGTGAGIAAVTAPSWLLLASSLAGFAVALWLGVDRASVAPVRSLVAAVALQSLLQMDWDPFFLASAFVTVIAGAVMAVSGLQRRPRAVRRRVLRGAIGVGAFVVVALVGMTAAGLDALSPASDGYDRLLAGLDALRQGDTRLATTELREAATGLRKAAGALDAPWSQPARLVPVLAQHRSVVAQVLDRAASAADAAADTLGLVDLDQLRVVNGVVDVDALALLAGPAAELERTVIELDQALDDASTPWLIDPFQQRLRTVQGLTEELVAQAEVTRVAVESGPALLGLDGPRRYLVAFTSPAEARGQSGLMGNWAELTFDRGRLRLTADGRTAELIDGLENAPPGSLDAPEEFFDRYGPYGAGEFGGAVRPKFWSNVTMSPHAPTVGSAMAQMYERSTGRAVDGVVIIDPAGIAALLELTGPVTLTDVGVTLTSETAEQFLLRDQYQLAEAEREDILGAATRATVDQILATDLPGPQVLAAELGDAVVRGHLTAFAVVPAEQRLFELLRMDAGLPEVAGTDGLAIVNDNASGNKIDTFLTREVRYRAVFDGSTGDVRSELTVTLVNEAPTTGYPEYVIGNLVDLPAGTNRTILSVYSPLELEAAELDGTTITMRTQTERGWRVHTTVVVIPPGGTVTVRLTLAGVIAAGEYELRYRPQPLAQPERIFADAVSPGGRLLAGFAGVLRERSAITPDGLSAWP